SPLAVDGLRRIARKRWASQADWRQQHLELLELEDHDGLAIVLGEVVHEQVVDAIAPQTAGDPLPFEVPDVGSPDPDCVVAGAAARAVRPPAELEPIGARTPDNEGVAVPPLGPIRVG